MAGAFAIMVAKPEPYLASVSTKVQAAHAREVQHTMFMPSMLTDAMLSANNGSTLPLIESSKDAEPRSALSHARWGSRETVQAHTLGRNEWRARMQPLRRLDAYECRRPNGALRYRCRACGKDFTLTSGTLFASHKLPLRTYLAAIAIFCNEVKGKSALSISRDPGVSYKACFVLLHKLREAMAGADQTNTVRLDRVWNLWKTRVAPSLTK
jgi:transposase-like protein